MTLIGPELKVGDSAPDFSAVDDSLKDVNLAVDTAEASAMPLPLGSLVRDRLLASVAKGRGEWDWTAIMLDIAEDSGLRKAAAG